MSVPVPSMPLQDLTPEQAYELGVLEERAEAAQRAREHFLDQRLGKPVASTTARENPKPRASKPRKQVDLPGTNGHAPENASVPETIESAPEAIGSPP